LRYPFRSATREKNNNCIITLPAWGGTMPADAWRFLKAFATARRDQANARSRLDGGNSTDGRGQQNWSRAVALTYGGKTVYIDGP
jgi:hypothetical protein